jgi:flagellar M-ring protein FliF
MNFLRQLGPVKLAITAVTLLSFLILFAIYFYKTSSSDMSVLYSDLDGTDTSRITTELDSKNIPYVLENEGTTIKVPESYVLKTRVMMASQGLPSHGSMVGYEIFDKEETLGTTNFLQNVKLMRALEGELTRTISTFDPVAKVRVHLVIPQREVFSKDRQEPRASVILKLKGSKSLNKNEINAISHLVVTAVPGLDIKNITIVDTAGRSLKLGGDEESSFEGGGGAAEDYRSNYENKLTRALEELLERSLGPGKVRARVSAEMNFDRIVTNAEIYDPDSAVLRSSQSIEERERTPVSGEDQLDISLANNLPGSGIGSDLVNNQAATVERTDETKNYEISKTIRNEISEAGAIQKLSVAVLVDGHYKKDPVSGEMEYSPRTPEELAQIEQLVKAAVGFKEERKDQLKVVNMPFMNDMNSLDEEDNWLREQLPSLFQSLILAIVVILVFLTIVRPLAIRLLGVSGSMNSDKDKDFALEGDDGVSEIEVSLVEQKVQAASMRKVNDVMNSHPEETLMVLRRWLNNNG